MKKLNLGLLSLLMISFFVLSSCGNEQKKEEVKTEEQAKEVDASKEEASDKEADEKSEAEKKAAKKKEMLTNKFKKFDANSDEKVTKEEFLTFSKKEAEEKDAKGNKDGKIQKEECPGFDTLSPDGKDLTIEEFVKAREAAFEKIDADKSGDFTLDEFLTFKMSNKKMAGKCGDAMKKGADNAKKAKKEMKCGEGKCGEGKCGK